MSNKMDKAGARTPADIERRYGKSFAETLGIAEDARNTAEKALKAANDVDGKLDHEEIFNRLTNNGQIKCIREIDGQIYINASYINSGKMSADRLNIEELFAKDINMSGTFTHTVDAFLYPGEPELKALRDALMVSFPAPYDPLLDFNSDGVLDAVDLTICQKAVLGLYDLSTWSGAVKKPVTMTINLANSEKAITFCGVNMWGRDVESYIGVNFTNIRNPETAQIIDSIKDYVTESGEAVIYEEDGSQTTWIYEKWKSGIAKMHGKSTRSVAINQAWGTVYRSGAQYFVLPISLSSVHSVIHNCFGKEEAVWGGQVEITNPGTYSYKAKCEAFCGNSRNPVTTTFYVEAIGKWV